MDTVKKKTIRWTDEEWDKLAIALHMAHPELRLHEAENFRMGVAPFMAVMRRTLSEDRWRVLHIPNDFKITILKRLKFLRPVLAKPNEGERDLPAWKGQTTPEIIPNEVPPAEPIIPEHTPPAEPILPDAPPPQPVIPNEPPPTAPMIPEGMVKVTYPDPAIVYAPGNPDFVGPVDFMGPFQPPRLKKEAPPAPILNPVLSLDILKKLNGAAEPEPIKEPEPTAPDPLIEPPPPAPPEPEPFEPEPSQPEPAVDVPPPISVPDPIVAEQPTAFAKALEQFQAEPKSRELGGFRINKSGQARAGRIFWDDEEWLKIARQLYKMNPQILHSNTLISIKNPDIVLAQNAVLPSDRHRLSQIPMDSARDKIKEGLKTVKAELAQQEEEKRKQEEEAKAAAYAEEQLAKEAARNPFEVALEPLMKLMKEQILLAIEPMLQEILDKVKEATHIKEEIVVDFHTPRKPPEPRKPRIAICGIRPDNARRVTDQFPQYEFLLTGEDVTDIVSAVRGCDKVLAMKWINHPDVWKLKRALGEKFVIINGGTAEMKRVIGIMETSGSLTTAAYSKN